MNNKVICIMFIISSVFFVSHVTEGGTLKKDALTLSSPAFEHNGTIPAKYTCDGVNVNPPVLIEHVPAGTKSLALIVDDPDAPAGTWVHWILWNMDPAMKEVKEGSVPRGAQQGLNDFRQHEYSGPCPPSGTHRYVFRVYALDKQLELKAGAGRKDLETAMIGHILAEGELIGKYR